MDLLIFGASGGTGGHLVESAVRRGHTVTAFVRDPSKFATAAVRVVRGDVLDAPAVRAAIGGQDAVISALGSRTLAPNALLEDASANIVAGMQAEGVRRLIVLGAAGALRDSGKYQSALTRLGFAFFKATLLRNPLRMQASQQQTIEASGLDYTIVLPPRLGDGPRQGAYRILPDGLPPKGLHLGRADLAEFMLDQLDDRTFVRATPYVAY